MHTNIYWSQKAHRPHIERCNRIQPKYTTCLNIYMYMLHTSPTYLHFQPFTCRNQPQGRLQFAQGIRVRYTYILCIRASAHGDGRWAWLIIHIVLVPTGALNVQCANTAGHVVYGFGNCSRLVCCVFFLRFALTHVYVTFANTKKNTHIHTHTYTIVVRERANKNGFLLFALGRLT